MYPFAPLGLVSLAYGLLLLAALRVVYSRWIRNRLYRRPPGPNPLPFLGNIHQLPAEYQERAILQWSKTFGDTWLIIIPYSYR